MTEIEGYVRDERLGVRGSDNAYINDLDHEFGRRIFEVAYTDYFLYFEGDQYHRGTIAEVTYTPTTNVGPQLAFEVAIKFDNPTTIQIDGICFAGNSSRIAMSLTPVTAEAIARVIVGWKRDEVDVQKIYHDNGIDFHFRIARLPQVRW